MKMLAKSKYLCAMGIALGVAGCNSVESNYQSIKSQPNIYLKSEQTAPIVIPADVDAVPLGQDQVIPSITKPSPKKAPDLVPPGSAPAKIKQGKLTVRTLDQMGHYGAATIEFIDNRMVLIIKDDKDLWSNAVNALKLKRYLILNENQKTRIIYILDVSATRFKVKRESPIYQVHIITVEGHNEMYVTDNEDKPVKNEVAGRILKDIYYGMHAKDKNVKPIKVINTEKGLYKPIVG